MGVRTKTMRCSTCLAVLIERGDSVVCPNCETIHSATLTDSFQHNFDRNLVQPSAVLRQFWSIIGWLVSALTLLLIGVVLGWLLRDRGLDFEGLSYATVTSWLANLTMTSSQEAEVTPNAPTSLQRSGFTKIQTPDRSVQLLLTQPSNASSSVQISHSGKIVPVRTLSDASSGEVMSAALDETGNLIQAARSGTGLLLELWPKLGPKRTLASFHESEVGTGNVAVQTLSTGIVLVSPDPSSSSWVARCFSTDGSLIWQLDLEASADTQLSLMTSPFDELIVLMRNKVSSPKTIVRSITPAGLAGYSAELMTLSQEEILATAISPLGEVLILFSGAPPRLVVIDAFGQPSSSANLVDPGALTSETQCLLDSTASHWRTTCLQNDRVRDFVYDARDGELDAVLQSEQSFPDAETLLGLFEDGAIGLSSGAASAELTPFTLPLRPFPDPAEVAIPETLEPSDP